jgi:cell division transport system permease protein
MRGLTYALNEATQSLLRGWRAALLAVITIAAGLFVLGFFMIVNTNLQPIVARWTEAAELSVYLRDDATSEHARVVEGLIAQSGLAAESVYVSKADAARRFATDFPDLAGAAEGLGHNPFPASFEVRLAPHAQQAGPAVDGLAATLSSAPGVADVRYDRRWLRRLSSAIQFVGGVGLAVIGLLAAAAALTVANVVRLAAYSRRDEIEIMKLVGAPLTFIRGPFVAEGVLQGGLGALLAIALLWAGFVAARARFGALASVALGMGSISFLPLQTSLLLVLGGMLLGCLGGLVVARTVR